MNKNRRILFVDDDLNLLSSFRRNLRKAFAVSTALGPLQGLEEIRNRGPFAVVVADLKMPKMDGIQFLRRVRELSPDTVRMMLTGHADLQTALDAVNQGHVFHFLTKPCAPEVLIRALKKALEYYDLQRSQKELLEGTLQGSIRVLTEMLSLVQPHAFGRAQRIRGLLRQMIHVMGLEEKWELETAAMLSQIGCVALDDGILKKLYQGEELSPEERKAFGRHPEVAADLLRKIPRMEGVAEIVRYQEKRFNGGGPPPDGLKGEDIPLGARILKVLLDYDGLESAGLSKGEAVSKMESREGWYDPQLLSTLKVVLGLRATYVMKRVYIAELKSQMVLAEDVHSSQGQLLLSKGQEITPLVMMRLRNFSQTMGVKEPISVVIPTEMVRKESAVPGGARQH